MLNAFLQSCPHGDQDPSQSLGESVGAGVGTEVGSAVTTGAGAGVGEAVHSPSPAAHCIGTALARAQLSPTIL